MTEQEAIKILSKDTSMEAVNELSCYGKFSKDYVVERIQEAMDMGAKALEKQVAVQDVLERLEEEKELSKQALEYAASYNSLQFDEAKGYFRGIANAIEIVKEGLK